MPSTAKLPGGVAAHVEVGRWVEFTAAGKPYTGLVVWIGNGVFYVAVVGFNGIMHVRDCRVTSLVARKPEPVSFTNA